MVKLTPAFLTRLLARSRTSTVIVELLLDCDADPVVTWTVPGMACTVALLAVVATNTTLRVAAGVTPGPEAVMIAGPAEIDEIVTPGVSPAAFVFALAVIVPRLAEKLTAKPTTATPAFFQLIETAVAVFRGMSM